ncbi:hypothetical protein [Pseudomonas putida]|uniref:hypothetical protein n=1 Tax=Pseudomonas putida TaxID=303 RepID=UPI00265B2C30|nr:hypothetical protein [Pseudomonas putida]MCZ9640488.1 hypothetical protein [Pseudomonas putida]
MTTTVEAKAAELAGAALDWAVAKANGEKLVEVEGKHSVITGFRLNPIRVPGVTRRPPIGIRAARSSLSTA